jgi:predicted transcriptional regulator YdeE
MIVNKKTIENTEEIKKIIATFKEFKNIEFIGLNELPEVIFQFKIAGRKTLEFCIIANQEGDFIADITNKVIVKELPTFKWGTAKAFSKTLVTIHNWDKLTMSEDGEFKI